MKKLIFFLFYILLFHNKIDAQSGLEGFNYQAVLKDNQNQAIKNQNIIVEFKILDAIGGNILYQESQNAITDATGLFNLVIGENKIDFTQINWGAGERFLQVNVNLSGNVIPMGIVKFQAVPYAKFALNSKSSSPNGVAGGDLKDMYPNPTVRAIQNNPVSNVPPQNGQILKWDAVQNSWKPDADNNQIYFGGPGIQINGNQIINTGDVNPNDDLTNNSIAGGDVSGNFNNLKVEKIQNLPILSTLPINGQVLKWDAAQNAWKPDADYNQVYSAGQGIQIINNQIINTGDLDATDDIITNSIAGGDLSGTFSNLQLLPNSVGSQEIQNGSIMPEDLDPSVLNNQHWTQNGNAIRNTNSGMVQIGSQNGANLGLLNVNSNGKNTSSAIYVEGPVRDHGIDVDPTSGVSGVGIHPQADGIMGMDIFTTNAKAIDAVTSGNFSPVAEFKQINTNASQPTIKLTSINPEIEFDIPTTSRGNIRFYQDNNGLKRYCDINGDPSPNGGVSFNYTEFQGPGGIVYADILNIKNSGRIGVNEVAPEATLHVDGDNNLPSAIFRKSNPNIIFKRDNEHNFHLNYTRSNSDPDLFNITYGPISEQAILFDLSANRKSNFYVNNFKINRVNDPGHLEALFNGNRTELWLSGTQSIINFERNTGGPLTYILNDPSANVLSIQNNNTGGRVTLKAPNIAFDGNVGIGVGIPTRGKLEIIRASTLNYFLNQNYTAIIKPKLAFNNSNFVPNGAAWVANSGGPVNYSIYAESRIACDEINVFSDARIKNIIGRSDSKRDLALLNAIEVTNYTYVDTVKNGRGVVKKLIGQQVAEVYPQAVKKNNLEFIPNIMQFAEILDQKIYIRQNSLKRGDKIKLIFEDGFEDSEVINVTLDFIYVSTKRNGKVLVYGKEVDDFHIVDYEAIAMLNVSATQELLKLVRGLEQNNKQLELKTELLHSKIEKMEATFNQLENKIKLQNQSN